MPYAVQAVSPHDAPGLARAMMSAFWEDQHWRTLWAGSSYQLETIISGCAERLPQALIGGRGVKRHLKVVDTDSGAIAGYSRYLMPESHAEKDVWLDAQTREPSEEEREEYERRFRSATDEGRIKGMDYDIAAEFGNPLAEVEEEILRGEGECFAVDYMTVHPAHQGNGVASMMLREALKHTDDAGLTAIVMASPAGKRLYEKQGFRLVRTFAQDDSKYGTTEEFVHHWLIRRPRKGFS